MPDRTQERFRELRDFALKDTLTTPEQRRDHRARVARQRARDEAKRLPSPQLPLDPLP
jgi:hypothetical protein